QRMSFVALAVLLLAAAAPEKPADLVLAGGIVITLDPGHPRATALAVRDGRIVAVGDDAVVRPFVGRATKRVALAGRTVVPGLTDAHVHVEGLGASLETLDLVGAATLAEARRRVAARVRTLKAGEWLIGRGWDQNDWPGQQFPTAADLDRVAAGHPVYLTRIDGHAGWASSKALTLAGIDAKTADPPGGRLIRDAAGVPTGVLVDGAQALVTSKI